MKNQWITLLIALGLPLLLIGVVILSIKVSATRVEPAYDVLYATGGSTYDPYYRVEGRRLTSELVDEQGEILQQEPISENDYAYENRKEMIGKTHFYRYDPITDSSSSVGGYAEARQLDIVSIDRSPDGYRVMENYENGGGFFFPFFFYEDGNRRGYVIEGNGGRKKVQLSGDGPYSTDIIGWISK